MESKDFYLVITFLFYSVAFLTGLYLMYISIFASEITIIVKPFLSVGTELRLGICAGGFSLIFYSGKNTVDPFLNIHNTRNRSTSTS